MIIQRAANNELYVYKYKGRWCSKVKECRTDKHRFEFTIMQDIDKENSGYIRFGKVTFPESMVGKKVRIKIEILEE